jgi:hypothetical protein
MYKVETFWDEIAQVWVATSEEIWGLATEAESLKDLSKKLKIIIPELLLLNQQMNKELEIKS